MNRPTGVTVIAVLDFLSAFFAVCGALLAFFAMALLGTYINQAAGNNVPAGVMAGLGVVLGAAFIFGAFIAALLGWGLWTLKEWARIVQMVLALLGAALGALGLLVALVQFHLFLLFFGSVRVAIHLLIAWYLNQPHVKAAFQRPAAAVAR